MDTLPNLRSAVRDWLHRGSDDISDSLIDSFVRIVDAKLNDDLRILNMENVTTLTLNSGASSVSLPTNFVGLISLTYADGVGELVPAPRHLVDRGAAENAAARPVNYAIHAQSLIFDRAADASYSITIRYYKGLDLVADSSNWLTATRPQIYFYGCMAEACKWTEAWEQAARYDPMFQLEVEKLKIGNHEIKKRARSRVDPALNSRGVFNINTGEF